MHDVLIEGRETMSYFYGTLQGMGGESTCIGSKKSGLVTHCASQKGAVMCRAYVNIDGVDFVSIRKVIWYGAGESEALYDGPIGKDSK